MKKLLVLFLLLFVVACSNDSSELVEADDQEQKVNESNKKEVDRESEVSSSDDNRSEEEVENKGRLEKVGDIAQDELGTHELLGVANIDEVINQGPLRIDFINAKIIKWSEMTSEYIDHLSHYGDIKNKEMIYVQFRLLVENESDQDINWVGVNNLITDKKQQIDGINEEFINRDLNANTYEDDDFYGNVEKEYVLGYRLKDEDIKNLRVIFSDVRGLDEFDLIEESFDYEIKFD